MLIGSYDTDSEVGHLVTRALPRVTHLTAGTIDGTPIDLLTRELSTDAIAQSSLLDRLIDIVLISAVRAWLIDLPVGTANWITATLETIHQYPEQPWTIGGLAGRVNISRATLASRFRNQVGTPPMTYLAKWRLTLASELLADPRSTMASIAQEIGYGSPFTLSTAFKKRFGASPAQYRKRKYLTRDPFVSDTETESAQAGSVTEGTDSAAADRAVH